MGLEFQWDSRNTHHIYRHFVEMEEAEEVFEGPVYIRRSGYDRYLAYGMSQHGRYLFIVFKRLGRNIIRVVTARDMDNKERRLYKRRAK